MSVVTSILLCLPTDDSASIGELNAWVAERHQAITGDAFRRVDPHAGGSKAMQADVYAAAINHLDVAGFAAFFRSLQWPEGTQLLIKGECDTRFTVETVEDE